MTRIQNLLRAAILLTVVAAAGVGQETFVLTSFQAPYSLIEVDVRGRVVGTVAQTPQLTAYQVLHDANNRDYLLLGQTSAAGFPGAVVRVTAAGVVTTIVQSAAIKAPPVMVVDNDGDHLIASRAANGFDTDLLRLRGATLTTVATAVNLAVDGLALDPLSDQLLVRGFTTQPLLFGYYRIDPRNGVVTTFTLPPVWNIRNLGIGARNPLFRGKGGLFIDMFASGTSLVGSVVRLTAENGLSTMNTFGPYSYPSDITTANGRAHPVAFRGLIYQTVGKNQSSIVALEEDGTARAVSPIGFPTWQRNTLLRVGSRHLVWRLTAAPNDRTLTLDFPGEAGRPYVVAASVSGVRPGLPVGDGRVIPITPDALTTIALAGGVPGVIDGTVGRLDAQGRATVRIRLNAIAPAIRGARIWFAAAVLDPAASRGFAQIVGPSVLTIR